MIPKVIHYCWFGRNPLPPSALKCIESWKKHMPGYKIVEWNEDNFDVNAIRYTQEAYNAKKYAFVSDYARFQILYEHGGLYFDTDVEVLKPFDKIIEAGPFMGFEIDCSNNSHGYVAPGLGIGAPAGLEIYQEILEHYKTISFLLPDGNYNLKTIVKYTTEILLKHGLKNSLGIQHIAGINLYPKEFFNPFNDETGRLRITSNTYSIHWYSKTWLNNSRLRTYISRLSHRILGTKTIPRLRGFFKRKQ